MMDKNAENGGRTAGKRIIPKRYSMSRFDKFYESMRSNNLSISLFVVTGGARHQ